VTSAAEPKNTRARIIDAAEAEFAENGFGGARIKNISSVAGVTNAMIHYYFNSKEELHRAVLVRMVEDLVQLVKEIGPQPIPPLEKLEIFFVSFFDYAARHRNFSRITSMETGHDNQEYFISLIEEHLRPLYGDAREFIISGINEGIFRDVNPDQLLTAIYAMTVTCFSDSPFLDVLIGESTTTSKHVATRRDLLMQMIFRMLLIDPPE